MSATIFWKPKLPAAGTVPCWAKSSFIEAMRVTFGDTPSWTLGPGDIPVLKGMAATHGPEDNPYRFLIEKIEQGGEARTITVWAEY